MPEDQGKLAEVLIAAVGSGHPLSIDGIGGGIDDEVGRAGADGTKTGGWPPLLSVGGLGRAVRD